MSIQLLNSEYKKYYRPQIKIVAFQMVLLVTTFKQLFGRSSYKCFRHFNICLSPVTRKQKKWLTPSVKFIEKKCYINIGSHLKTYPRENK